MSERARPRPARARRGLGDALLFGAITLCDVACRPSAPLPPPAPPPAVLHLEPACDLAPAAGLDWVVDARPRAIAELPDLIPVIARVVPESRFDAFTKAHGGIDVRQITDLCVAKYRHTSLSVARTPFDAARLETTFRDRMTNPGGRQIDVPDPPVVRLWGEVNGERQQLVMFGHEAVAFEQGDPGPLRATEAFARGRLKKASPALHGATLARVVALVGAAPIRAFGPGPFEGELAAGLGGLMAATTAIGASAQLVDASTAGASGAPTNGPVVKISIRLVLMGAWGKDAPAAGERLLAALHVVAESPLGRLLGIDHPLAGPIVRTTDEALLVDATVDGLALARGLHDALDAEIGEILRR